MIQFQLDHASLRPLIEAVVEETVRRLEDNRNKLPDQRIAFTEEEAARLIGLESHQLRDERRRGRIVASAVCGRRIRYTRQDIEEYLRSRRWEKHS